jgi:hypothetical protein
LPKDLIEAAGETSPAVFICAAGGCRGAHDDVFSVSPSDASSHPFVIFRLNGERLSLRLRSEPAAFSLADGAEEKGEGECSRGF